MCPTSVSDVAQVEANKLVALGQLAVDPHGRRWLMLGRRKGFTHSVHGGWWFGDRFHPRTHELTLVTAPAVVAALDAWELALVDVDTDPTEPAGVARADELVAS